MHKKSHYRNKHLTNNIIRLAIACISGLNIASNKNFIGLSVKVSDLFNLTGKTSLVTNCNSDIEHAMATGLTVTGVDIIIYNYKLAYEK